MLSELASCKCCQPDTQHPTARTLVMTLPKERRQVYSGKSLLWPLLPSVQHELPFLGTLTPWSQSGVVPSDSLLLGALRQG